MLFSKQASYDDRLETALDHYFFNENTAPFLVAQLIKRFGNSSPSPRYVLEAASGFRSTHFEEDDLSVQLKQVVKLIKSKDIRDVHRDVFYTTMYGFDHHADLKSNNTDEFPILDYAIDFLKERMIKIE